MSIFLIALLSALAGGLNPSFSKIRDDLGEYLIGWLWRAVVMLVVLWPTLYWFWHPALGTMTLGGLLPVVALLFTINLIATFSGNNDTEGTPITIAVLLWVWTLIFWIGGTSMFQSTSLAAALSPRPMKIEEATFTSPRHLRPISKEQAVFWMSKLMNAEIPGKPGSIVGSSFSIDEEALRIQKVDGKLYWVAPLEFNSYWRWRAEDGKVPYYAKLLAEEADARAELVQTKQPMRYMTSSRQDENLARHIYAGYAGYYIEDFSFEINDDGDPYWVVSLLSPRSFNGGAVLKKVVIVDAISGAIAPTELSKLPEWVDLAVPADAAKNWAHDWGMYKDGWLNATFSKENCYDVIGDPIEIFGDDGHIYWHVAMRAANKDQGGVAGFMHINARTGESRWYRLTTPAANYESALKSATTEFKNHQLLSAHGTEPIPYILYGRLVYIFPAIGDNEVYQRLVMVDAMDSAIVASGIDGPDTLRAFRSKLSEKHTGVGHASGSTPPTRSVKGTVFRIGTESEAGQTQYFITLKEDPDHIYIGPRSKGRQLPVTLVGDSVEIEINETEDDEITVVQFHNLTLDTLKKR